MTRRLPLLAAGCTVLVLVAALVLLGFNAGELNPAQLGFEIVLAAAVVLYAGTGLLLSRRVPGNAIGWLLALIGLLLAGELFAEQYAVYGLVTASRVSACGQNHRLVLRPVCRAGYLRRPFPAAVVPRWTAAFVSAGGRFERAFGVALAATVASQMQAGQVISGGLTDVLDKAHAYPNPVGIVPQHGWGAGFVAVAVLLTVVAGLTSVAAVFARRRGANR